jgi:hypothetical protein
MGDSMKVTFGVIEAVHINRVLAASKENEGSKKRRRIFELIYEREHLSC